MSHGTRIVDGSLLLGIVAWLLIEAAFSARFGVWFNVGVDAVYSRYE